MTRLAHLLLVALLSAEPSPEDSVAAITALIEAGKLSEAAKQLESASLPEVTQALLSGQIAMARGEWRAAERSFQRVLHHHPELLEVRLHLAQVQIQSERFEAAIATLQAAPEGHTRYSAYAILLATAYRGQSQPDQAYQVLVAAHRDFPSETAIPFELAVLCLDRSLIDCGMAWIEKTGALDESHTIAIMQSLAQIPGTLAELEDLAARHPNNATAQATLAYAYAWSGASATAAKLFERALHLGADVAFEAADQWRVAGHTQRALQSNAAVEDSKRRLDQRASILFSGGALARLIAMKPTLERAQLMTPIQRYRLAYAHYALGQLAQASELARSLVGTDQAEQGRALLAAMGRRSTAN